MNTVNTDALDARSPAEDLAGQGEPVKTWLVERVVAAECARDAYAEGTALEAFHNGEIVAYEKAIEFVNALAAPAPSRPADREEIAEIIRDALFSGKPGLGYPGLIEKAASRILALRDAPRDGGDGWEPLPARIIRFLIASTAGADREEDEDLIPLRDWGRDRYDGLRRELGSFEAARRQSLTEAVAMLMSAYPALPAPPSPNAGDGTQDRRGGGR